MTWKSELLIILLEIIFHNELENKDLEKSRVLSDSCWSTEQLQFLWLIAL